jgi:Glycosyl hydrolases family 6
VILEPDALALALACDAGNLDLLRYAVSALERQANTAVYIDAGDARWVSMERLAEVGRMIGGWLKHAKGSGGEGT